MSSTFDGRTPCSRIRENSDRDASNPNSHEFEFGYVSFEDRENTGAKRLERTGPDAAAADPHVSAHLLWD